MWSELNPLIGLTICPSEPLQCWIGWRQLQQGPQWFSVNKSMYLENIET